MPPGRPNKTIGTGSLRDSVGLPINAYTYRAFHYTDANNDGYITPNEVTVDPNISYTGYSIPRDIASISNGFDLFARKVRINSLFDYKGGGLLVNTNLAFQCNNTPQAVSGRLDAQLAAGAAGGGVGDERPVHGAVDDAGRLHRDAAVLEVPRAVGDGQSSAESRRRTGCAPRARRSRSPGATCTRGRSTAASTSKRTASRSSRSATTCRTRPSARDRAGTSRSRPPSTTKSPFEDQTLMRNS